MRLKYVTTKDEQFLTIETLARRIEGLDVDYRGQGGTVIEGSEKNFRKIVKNIEDERDKIWDQMTDGTSNRKATELDDKRIDLRNARNRLKDALSNPEHEWRDS